MRCTGVLFGLLAAAPPAVRPRRVQASLPHGKSALRAPLLVRHLSETDAERKARVLAELDQLLRDPALIRGREHIRVAHRAVYYDNPGGRVPRNYARDVRARVERIQRQANTSTG